MTIHSQKIYFNLISIIFMRLNLLKIQIYLSQFLWVETKISFWPSNNAYFQLPLYFFFLKLADIIWIFNRLHFDHILAYKIIILWSNEFILLSRAPLLHSWQGDLAPQLCSRWTVRTVWLSNNSIFLSGCLSPPFPYIQIFIWLYGRQKA